MNVGTQDLSLKSLLAPQPFRRERYSSFLYTPYSFKLKRRVYLYTHSGYDLWVRLESGTGIAEFNERVPLVPLAFEGGHATLLAPIAVSVRDDGAVEIHTFRHSESDEDTEDVKSIAWKRWCDLHGFIHQEWTVELLQKNRIELANLKRLLRFTSCVDYVPNVALEKSILAELGNVRKTTFAKLVQQFPLSDPDEVQQSLARLILNRDIHSDIHYLPLSMITEVSAYHELHPNPS